MKIAQEDEEKVVLIIQAAIGIIVILLAVRESVKSLVKGTKKVKNVLRQVKK